MMCSITQMAATNPDDVPQVPRLFGSYWSACGQFLLISSTHLLFANTKQGLVFFESGCWQKQKHNTGYLQGRISHLCPPLIFATVSGLK